MYSQIKIELVSPALHISPKQTAPRGNRAVGGKAVALARPRLPPLTADTDWKALGGWKGEMCPAGSVSLLEWGQH